MPIQEATIYRAVCDCCAAEAEYYEGFWGWLDPSDAIYHAEGFQRVGDEVLCDQCCCWPEDLPDYPGDDRWQGGDAPVRKVGCHPSSPDSGFTEEKNDD